MLNIIQAHMYIHLCSFSIFLISFLCLSKSLTKIQVYGNIRMKFYLWAALQHLRLFTGNFHLMGSPSLLIVSMAISQVIYFIRGQCSREFNLQQMLAKQEYLSLCFLILKYKFSDKYDQKIERQIKLIMTDEEIESNLYQDQSLFQKVVGMLNKRRTFQHLILEIELNFINGHFLSAMNMIVKVKQQLQWYQFLNKIILFKIEYHLIKKFNHKISGITMIYQKELRSFLSFQQKLNKSAKENLKLTKYLKRSVTQLSVIKRIGSKITRYQNEIHRLYEQTSKFFIASTEYYFSYLMKVKKDYQTAKNILCTYLISEKYLVDFELRSKIYIKLRIQGHRIMIEKVGFNCKQLLDYSKKDLQGLNIQKMIPIFYRNQHQRLCNNYIHQKLEQVCLFQKRTLVLNNKQKYKQCNLVLKLNFFIEDGFYLEGHIHVVENEKYDLNRFFFANQNGKILEANQQIFNQFQFINHSIDQFFVGQTGTPISQQYELDMIVYDPIMILKNSPNLVYFYAKRLQNRKQRSRKGITTKQLKQANQFYESNLQKYFQYSQINQLQKKIYNNQILVLLFLCALFIFGLFACEYLLIISSQVNKYHQGMVVSNGENLMQYYDNLFILTIDLTYLDLNNNFKYNNPAIQINLMKASLLLSQFNERLKPYNGRKYVIPSSNNLMTYQESNFQLIQMLISNSYAYQQFQNDPFMKNKSLEGFQQLLYTLLINSFTDYRISVFSLVSNYVQENHFYNNIALASNLITLVIIALFIFRIYILLRNNQKMTLKYRCLTVSSTKIIQILQFLHQLTSDDNQMDKNFQGKQLILNENFQALQTEGPIAKTETSFVRQASKIDLIQDTLNKTNLQQSSGAQGIEPKMSVENSQRSFKDTRSYIQIVVICLLFVGLLFSLVVSNQIVNHNLRDVDQMESINSIITLYRASAFYSRAIVITLNTIILKQLRNVDNYQNYQQQINTYYTYLRQFIIPKFPETQFPEFAQYTFGYNQLYHKSICQYIICKSKYSKNLDLSFMTVINKLSANLSHLVDSTMNMSSSQSINFINSPQIYEYLGSLFETQSLIRAYTIKLSMTYLSNYKVFMINLFSSKMSYIISIMTITAIGFLLFLSLILYIRNQQALLIHIIRLYY